MNSVFSHDELQRYGRQMVLDRWGEEGQTKLKNSNILIIGAGGLGSSVLSHLACVGIGHIGIVDDDRVELSNLNRQIIHETGDIGSQKIMSAKERIYELNPHIDVTGYAIRLSSENASDLVASYDLIIDCVDNFQTRYVINQICYTLKKTWIYCAIRGFEGQLSSFDPAQQHNHACYQCFVPSVPHHYNDCSERGAVGSVLGVMGSLSVMEAIKIIIGYERPLYNTLLRYHALQCDFKKSQIMKDPECLVCSKNKAC